MGRGYDIVTFDCYGTLVDWESGIFDAFRDRILPRGAPAPDRSALLEAYGEIEPEVERGSFRPYREVLRETARRVAARFGTSIDAEAEALASSLPEWPPFADTRPALVRLLEAGYALGVLSNVDEDLFEATRRRLDVEFEIVVTAARVGSYKPAPGHFREARARIGDRRWLHAAQSLFHDIEPACSLGIPAAWINRKGEPGPRDAHGVLEVKDLAALAERLGA